MQDFIGPANASVGYRLNHISTPPDEAPRILVLQLGARHNYAVPTVFERAGMLEAFYTDMCAGRGFGRLAEAVARIMPMKAVKALSTRRPPEAVLAKTRTFDMPALMHALRMKLEPDAHKRNRLALHYDESFGRRLAAIGGGRATHVFTSFGHGGPFLSHAKQGGAKIVADVIVALATKEIMLAEHRAFPEWGALPIEQRALMGPEFQVGNRLFDTTDLFICPSEFVRDDLTSNWGVRADATRVVPYAVGSSWFDLISNPESGRVLFAGTADLRKGIHYFAMAADQLISLQRRYRFRVAGGVRAEVKQQRVCKNLIFIGRVLRTEMREEFEKADVMVLPTLAEGSAGVTYEALAAGVPVVTTRAAGSIVRHKLDGLIVPERDPNALAQAIEMIVEDRKLRAAMSKHARERAREFTWQNYEQRLIRAITM